MTECAIEADEWPEWRRDTRCEWMTQERERCARRTNTASYGGLILCPQHKKGAADWIYWYLREHVGIFHQISRELTHARHDDALAGLPDPGRSLVYFIERGGLVKIGTTVNIAKRMQDISNGSSMIRGMVVGPVRLLATMPGDRRHELFLHQRFHELRVDGEWFLPDEDLIKFIKRWPDVNHELLEEVAIRHELAELAASLARITNVRGHRRARGRDGTSQGIQAG